MPNYESVRDDEHNIFIYSGHVPPGRHTLYLYDPEDKKFYKKDNIIIYPNLLIHPI